MAVKRIHVRGPATRQEVLCAITIWPGGEDHSQWEYRRGGEWQLIVPGGSAGELGIAPDVG